MTDIFNRTRVGCFVSSDEHFPRFVKASSVSKRFTEQQVKKKMEEINMFAKFKVNFNPHLYVTQTIY